MPPQAMITGAMLYDLVQCLHRVAMDVFADPSTKDKVSPFVQLLWDKGTAFEKDVVGGLKQPFLDLSSYTGPIKQQRTIDAMNNRAPLIYSGRISSGDLLGEPDLLRLSGAGYVAGDIKSGAGEEGGSDDDDDDGKPKVHYAVQLGLYTDVLEKLGKAAGRSAFVWDIHGREVTYNFDELIGVRNPTTLWTKYQDALSQARTIVAAPNTTRPAYGAVCKNCVWYSTCMAELDKANDLTLIPFLGRSKRDVMVESVPTVRDFAGANPDVFVVGKKTQFSGIGPDSLRKFHARAQLLSTTGAQPYLSNPITLPAPGHELFFDIEVDPMRDICYLHGFVERNNGAEKFVHFLAAAPTPQEEKAAFKGAWDFMQSAPSAAIYYYSKYERTIYRKLQKRYPDVCDAQAVEELFAPSRSVDLYFDIVFKATEWPTHDFSLKALAKFLGFTWRDTHPSGAASIEWYHRWVETGDDAIRQRILEYNEDDCKATRILLDGVRALS